MQAQPPTDQSGLVGAPIAPIAANASIKGILLFHAIQWVAGWISAYVTLDSTSIQNFHLDNWGVDIFFGILWILLTLIVGCGPAAVKRSPLQWVLYILHTATTIYLASTLVSFFDGLSVFYLISAGTGAVIGALVYALATKTALALADSFLYVLAGVAIFYQGFIIFSDLDILFLIVAGLLGLVLGLYLIYDVTNFIAGTFYALQAGGSLAGAVCAWLEYVLFPLRIISAIGSAFRPRA